VDHKLVWAAVKERLPDVLEVVLNIQQKKTGLGQLRKGVLLLPFAPVIGANHAIAWLPTSVMANTHVNATNLVDSGA
jgi:hypothetical protein